VAEDRVEVDLAARWHRIGGHATDHAEEDPRRMLTKGKEARRVSRDGMDRFRVAVTAEVQIARVIRTGRIEDTEIGRGAVILVGHDDDRKNGVVVGQAGVRTVAVADGAVMEPDA
jgi:hypothetical protein